MILMEKCGRHLYDHLYRPLIIFMIYLLLSMILPHIPQPLFLYETATLSTVVSSRVDAP